jgi:hypothetical protein
VQQTLLINKRLFLAAFHWLINNLHAVDDATGKEDGESDTIRTCGES